MYLFHHLATLERWYYTTQVAGFVFVVAGVVIASRVWRNQLSNERIDACLSSHIRWRNSFNRVLSVTGGNPALWSYHKDCWDAWSSFEADFAVARRYNKRLSAEWIDQGAHVMQRFTHLCTAAHGAQDHATRLVRNAEEGADVAEMRRALSASVEGILGR